MVICHALLIVFFVLARRFYVHVLDIFLNIKYNPNNRTKKENIAFRNVYQPRTRNSLLNKNFTSKCHAPLVLLFVIADTLT